MTYKDKQERKRKQRARHVRAGMKWLRHRKECTAGKHCEDPFCHHKGPCTCGLDDYLNGQIPPRAEEGEKDE